MSKEKLKKILLFFIEHKREKKTCSDFFDILRSLGISLADEIAMLDESNLGAWYSFSEYFLFDLGLYASNYPVPELDHKELTELREWIEMDLGTKSP